MRQVIAEQVEEGTGAIIGARTVDSTEASCLVIGNELAVGIVELRNEGARESIRVSADQRDYQQARVYEDGKLIESLEFRDGSVVYVNEAATRSANDARAAAS